MNILIEFFNNTYDWISDCFDTTTKRLKEEGTPMANWAWNFCRIGLKLTFYLFIILVTIENILLIISLVSDLF